MPMIDDKNQMIVSMNLPIHRWMFLFKQFKCKFLQLHGIVKNFLCTCVETFSDPVQIGLIFKCLLQYFGDANEIAATLQMNDLLLLNYYYLSLQWISFLIRSFSIHLYLLSNWVDDFPATTLHRIYLELVYDRSQYSSHKVLWVNHRRLQCVEPSQNWCNRDKREQHLLKWQ